MSDCELDEYIIKVLKEQDDGFIIPGQSTFWEIEEQVLFCGLRRLVETGKIRRRDCTGIAYEFAD